MSTEVHGCVDLYVALFPVLCLQKSSPNMPLTDWVVSLPLLSVAGYVGMSVLGKSPGSYVPALHVLCHQFTTIHSIDERRMHSQESHPDS